MLEGNSEALRMLEQALELDPDSFLAGVFLHCTLHLTGRFQEAVARAQEVLTMSGRRPGTMAFLIATFCDWGKTAEAETIYMELTARARGEYVPPSALVTASHALGLQEEALSQIRQSIQISDPYRHLGFSKYFRYGERLYANGRCRELLRKAGFE